MARPRNVLKVDRLRAGWTIRERLREVALELKNLEDIISDGYPNDEDAAMFKIALGEYDEAIAICDGNYEPPDPPGWEVGFAENH